ncbi:uracil DNA N-glycosylase Thp1 [Yamadazyma tenuis]|uniref:uracil DNA N-glycosylase Thp1 n=1 Tax=Candida tenuis TaxID=2315449 RepID=UPI0027AA2182|nr:uracil DNA N-glycosylase Thp1 [Yamadazyma tenuis]
MSIDPASRLRKFRYSDTKKVSKPKPVKHIKSKKTRTVANYEGLNDLNPSVQPDLQVLFVGFNPGVESSRTQHHYAHHTNLFWKLFNQSRLLFWVLERNGKTNNKDDLLLNQLTINGESHATAVNDFELIKYNIGFTDLVLRCTKSAQELTMQEKLDNVPRLLREWNLAQAKKIVIIGKGIWEIIIKKQGIKVQRFDWGVQNNAYTQWVCSEAGIESDIHVLPNTSGLVTSMNFAQKLALWNEIKN